MKILALLILSLSLTTPCFSQKLSPALAEILMLNIYPNITTSSLKKIILDYGISNFNLVGRWNRKRVTEVISFIKKNINSYPLIAVDEEGYLSRLPFLKSLSQAKMFEESIAEEEARLRAKKLKELGFNMVFSPVLDWTTNSNAYIYKRTFQADLEKTIKLGLAMMNGYSTNSFFAIPKHFPCYKNEVANPHGNSASNYRLEDFNDCLKIFKEVINNTKVVGIMVGHVMVDNKPITRSKNFVNFIKNDFDFDGLLVTDSVGMKSFFLSDNIASATKEAILAGYDLIILPSNLSVSFKILDFLQETYLFEDEFRLAVNEKYHKIKIFKQNLSF
ncbi:MAG: hypothetical protein NZ822_02920 [Patescibacteria group bacterium]|nr:hypothetical protein [Patescibacteria group bacterium]